MSGPIRSHQARPSRSPYPSVDDDGGDVVFVSGFDGGNGVGFVYEVWTMSIRDKRRRQLTQNRSVNAVPAFWPDARSFIFVSDENRNDRYEL